MTTNELQQPSMVAGKRSYGKCRLRRDPKTPRHDYQSQPPGLGAEFLDKVESVFRDIAMNPERWPVIRHEIRRRVV